MRLRRLGGAVALFLLGLSVSARADDDSTAPARNKFLGGRFGQSKSDAIGAPRTTTPIAEMPTFDKQREDEDYFRRLKVCDRLRDIARTTNNDALERQAHMLEQRAYQVYMQRCGLGSVRSSDVGEPWPRTNVPTTTLREGDR
jgi:hypothetical protein